MAIRNGIRLLALPMIIRPNEYVFLIEDDGPYRLTRKPARGRVPGVQFVEQLRPSAISAGGLPVADEVLAVSSLPEGPTQVA
jgi:hypothetical protein